MRVLNGVISSAMSQVVDGNLFVFAGEVRESKRLLDDLVVLVIGGSYIGIIEDVDIVWREEVEVSDKVFSHIIVEGGSEGWWWEPQE